MQKQIIHLASDSKLFEKLIESYSKQAILKIIPESNNVYATLVAAILSDQNKGVLLSEDSIQASIILNKFENIRAAICYNQYSASMCRQHNDANLLIIPLDQISEQVASEFLTDFTTAQFENVNTPNHQRRVNKLKLTEFKQ